MSGNVSDTEESELSVKQEQMIAALVAGNSIVVSAAVVGVSEKTAHAWLKLPHFKQAYTEAKQFVYDEALEQIRQDKKLTREMLLKHINAEIEVTPASQIQAARVLLERYIVAGELAELREQQKAIQEKLESLGVKL